jgi:hypothetical protein
LLVAIFDAMGGRSDMAEMQHFGEDDPFRPWFDEFCCDAGAMQVR